MLLVSETDLEAENHLFMDGTFYDSLPQLCLHHPICFLLDISNVIVNDCQECRIHQNLNVLHRDRLTVSPFVCPTLTIKEQDSYL